MNRIKKRFLHTALAMAFLLGCHKGYVALWEVGAAEPKQIFPLTVDSLPPADQELLERGIRVETVQELAQLIEDYLS